MKKVTDLFIVFALFIVINVIIKCFWIYYLPQHCETINDSSKKTLIVGSSLIECDIDDNVLDTYLNLGESALWFSANYGSVIWANEYNKLSIDTVVCGVGLTSMLYYTPGGRFETDELIHRSEKYSLLCYSDFLKTFNQRKGFLKSVFTPLNFNDFRCSRIGGHYLPIDRNKLHDSHVFDDIKSCQQKYGKNGFTEEVIRKEVPEQVHFLKKIHDYCKTHNLTFIVMNTPCYKIHDFMSDRGYKDYLLHEFGEELLIADYCDFEFPDDSYYGDMEHLNKKGAVYFSSDIKEKGLRLMTAKEYCK